MAETTISQLRVNGETRDIADSWARQQLDSSGDHGHKIMDESGVIYPNRRKLKFINADVSDDAENDTTIVDINVTRFIEKPTVTVDDYEYDGTEHGPTIVGLTDDMVVRDAKKIDYGSYILVISLKNKQSMQWNDMTKVDLVYNYRIIRKRINKPNITGSWTYDGNEHFPEITDFDSNTMSMTGDIAPMTEPGNYSINIDLKDKANTMWADETTTILEFPLSISKIVSNVSINCDSIVRVDPTHLYQDITVTYNGEERPTHAIIEGESNIVSVELLSGSTYRVTSVNDGSVVIHFGTDESTYYYRNDVQVTFNSSTVAELNNCTWQQISQLSSENRAQNYWAVGDMKEITINGSIGDFKTVNNLKVYVFIMGFNHNSDLEGTGITFGCFKMMKTIDGVESIKDIGLYDEDFDASRPQGAVSGDRSFSMEHYFTTNSNNQKQYYNHGGWAACDMRYDILGSTDRAPSPYGSIKTSGATGQDPSSTCTSSPKAKTLMSTLPSDLRAVMKPITKYSFNDMSNYDNINGMTSTIDYLPLPSEKEITGVISEGGFTYEDYYDKQYDYYKNGNSIEKYVDATKYYWPWDYWIRSPGNVYHSGYLYYDVWGCVKQDSVYYSYVCTDERAISPVFLV